VRRFFAALPYFIVALIIMGPLLAPGYVLTLDMVFAPPFPDWLQKLGLLAGFVAAGVGAHRLFTALWRTDKRWPAYFAGLFYMINPFVYSRFMAGQYQVLLGYVLLPFFVRAWLLFLREPSLKRAIAASFWLTLISVVSIHTFGLAILAILLFSAAQMYAKRADERWRRNALRHTAICIVLTLIASSYWLVPALLGQGRTVSAVAGFGSSDLAAFATSPNGFGWLGNVLSLQGFWGDGKNLYLVPMDIFSWWWLPWIAVWALVIFGMYTSWQKQRAVTAPFIALIIIAAVLAIGTAGTIVAPLNAWLVGHVPFFAGYREPQKFVALIALGYAYFGAVAVAALAEKIKLAVLPLFALPVLIAPLLPGFYGQLTPRQYPPDWFEANSYLQQANPNAKVLFLPWHLYMPFTFAGRDIANPAPRFFTNPIIISNDPEMAGAKSYASTKDQQEIQTNIIPILKRSTKTIAPSLRMLNIRYVILAKELDYKMYANIDVEDGIKLVRETETLKLYEVTQK
jgi:hypothetical protein